MSNQKRQNANRTGKQKYWQKYVREWEASNLTQSEYCRKNNLPCKLFNYWKRRLTIGHPISIIELPIKFPLVNDNPKIKSIDQNNTSGINLEIAGVKINISENFSKKVLKKVLISIKEI